MADINDKTGTPHTLSLGDVLAEIMLAPGQVSEFLRGLAIPHLGGASDDMARVLLQHANSVADPATYGPNAPDNPQARWGTTTPVPASGAAQGQSALPATGTTNEPSWMADARAAGWNRADDTAKQPVATPASARHYDETQGKWVDNATGQPVDVGAASTSTPPQPSAPRQ